MTHQNMFFALWLGLSALSGLAGYAQAQQMVDQSEICIPNCDLCVSGDLSAAAVSKMCRQAYDRVFSDNKNFKSLCQQWDEQQRRLIQTWDVLPKRPRDVAMSAADRYMFQTIDGPCRVFPDMTAEQRCASGQNKQEQDAKICSLAGSARAVLFQQAKEAIPEFSQRWADAQARVVQTSDVGVSADACYQKCMTLARDVEGLSVQHPLPKADLPRYKRTSAVTLPQEKSGACDAVFGSPLSCKDQGASSDSRAFRGMRVSSNINDSQAIMAPLSQSGRSKELTSGEEFAPWLWRSFLDFRDAHDAEADQMISASNDVGQNNMSRQDQADKNKNQSQTGVCASWLRQYLFPFRVTYRSETILLPPPSDSGAPDDRQVKIKDTPKTLAAWFWRAIQGNPQVKVDEKKRGEQNLAGLLADPQAQFSWQNPDAQPSAVWVSSRTVVLGAAGVLGAALLSSQRLRNWACGLLASGVHSVGDALRSALGLGDFANGNHVPSPEQRHESPVVQNSAISLVEEEKMMSPEPAVRQEDLTLSDPQEAMQRMQRCRENPLVAAPYNPFAPGARRELEQQEGQRRAQWEGAPAQVPQNMQQKRHPLVKAHSPGDYSAPHAQEDEKERQDLLHDLHSRVRRDPNPAPGKDSPAMRRSLAKSEGSNA